MLAIEASVFSVDAFAEEVGELLLCGYDAALVVAGEVGAVFGILLGGLAVFFCKKLEDERHSHILCVKYLLKVARAGVLIDCCADLVDSGQRVENDEIALRKLHLCHVEDVAVLEAEIFLLARETLVLDAGHIEHVELANDLGHRLGFIILHTVCLDGFVLNVLGELQLLRGDQYDLDSGVSRKCLNKGMDRSAVLEVAAEADGEAVELMLMSADGAEVGKCLGGMAVRAVTRVDYGDRSILRRNVSRACEGMAHCDDVGIAGNDASSISYAFALRRGRISARLKAENATAELEHCRLEGKAGSGGGLEEEGRDLLAVTSGCIFRGVCNYIVSGVKKCADFLLAEVKNIDQASHFAPFTLR